MLEAGCTYTETAAIVGVSSQYLGRIDQRMGYPAKTARQQDPGSIRGPACLVCGRSAPDAERRMSRRHDRPLCERHIPLGNAAWALRRQGLSWPAIAARLRFAEGQPDALRAAKINRVARTWKSRREARSRQRRRKRVCKV